MPLAALFYYPEIVVEDEDYRIQNDIACRMQPIVGIADESAERHRIAIGRMITNPTAHRAELVAVLIKLAPPAE